VIYRFVVDGGTWMLPILALSVVGFAFVLERAGYWLKLAISRDGRLRKRLLAGETPPPGATVSDPVARVLVDAIRRPDDFGIASARADRILRESKSHLGLLRVIAGVAALSGFLATSVAVRDAFRLTTDPARLGTAVANSLHATILGLAIFLGAYLAAAIFQALTGKLAREIDDHLDEIARNLRRPPLALATVPAATSAASTASAPPEQPGEGRRVLVGSEGTPVSTLASALDQLGPDEPGSA